ncbi:hypothetical protein QQP08_004330 [Theobroma cacao]|nr:hypothetical protein QQP08_004330 [Theobroma cacao]
MSLPSIGKLPLLKEVRIDGLNNVTSVGVEFFGENMPKAFPSLEILQFRNMLQWENWNLCDVDDKAREFPKLRELCMLGVKTISDKLSPCTSRSLSTLGGCMICETMLMVLFRVERLIGVARQFNLQISSVNNPGKDFNPYFNSILCQGKSNELAEGISNSLFPKFPQLPHDGLFHSQSYNQFMTKIAIVDKNMLKSA